MSGLKKVVAGLAGVLVVGAVAAAIALPSVWPRHEVQWCADTLVKVRDHDPKGDHSRCRVVFTRCAVRAHQRLQELAKDDPIRVVPLLTDERVTTGTGVFFGKPYPATVRYAIAITLLDLYGDDDLSRPDLWSFSRAEAVGVPQNPEEVARLKAFNDRWLAFAKGATVQPRRSLENRDPRRGRIPPTWTMRLLEKKPASAFAPTDEAIAPGWWPKDGEPWPRVAGK